VLLAGDIGGTKTHLGVFERLAPRPRPLFVWEFETLAYRDLTELIAKVARGAQMEHMPIESACFGVAGVINGRSAQLTNVPWCVDADQIARTFNIATVSLLNDLEAMAHAVPLLDAEELHSLQPGEADRSSSIALIAAGTGLGEATLRRIGGRFVVAASEGGHADFAARTEQEIALLRDLTGRFGRAGVEHVLSGSGFVHIHRVAHEAPCRAGIDLESPDAPAAISTAALEGRCASCVRTLEMFVEAYGAEAGNLALRSVARGGVFVGGGIARKILPALTGGRFMRAFTRKAPFEEMLRRIPVNVIMHPEAGLLGAAAFAGHT
jgi:glucokinase